MEDEWPQLWALYDHDKRVAVLTVNSEDELDEIFIYNLKARFSCHHYTLPGQCARVERITSENYRSVT